MFIHNPSPPPSKVVSLLKCYPFRKAITYQLNINSVKLSIKVHCPFSIYPRGGYKNKLQQSDFLSLNYSVNLKTPNQKYS